MSIPYRPEFYTPTPAREAYEEMESQRDAALFKLATERGRCVALEQSLSDAESRCSALAVILGIIVVAVVCELGYYLLR